MYNVFATPAFCCSVVLNHLPPFMTSLLLCAYLYNDINSESEILKSCHSTNFSATFSDTYLPSSVVFMSALVDILCVYSYLHTYILKLSHICSLYERGKLGVH